MVVHPSLAVPDLQQRVSESGIPSVQGEFWHIICKVLQFYCFLFDSARSHAHVLLQLQSVCDDMVINCDKLAKNCKSVAVYCKSVAKCMHRNSR